MAMLLRCLEMEPGSGRRAWKPQAAIGMMHTVRALAFRHCNIIGQGPTSMAAPSTRYTQLTLLFQATARLTRQSCSDSPSLQHTSYFYTVPSALSQVTPSISRPLSLIHARARPCIDQASSRGSTLLNGFRLTAGGLYSFSRPLSFKVGTIVFGTSNPFSVQEAPSQVGRICR
jgi:hypothetical protein